MFIFTDFISHVFIVLVLAGAFSLLIRGMKKDIELMVGKKILQEIGWGWGILIWIFVYAILEIGWYVLTKFI